eukprot:1065879_1
MGSPDDSYFLVLSSHIIVYISRIGCFFAWVDFDGPKINDYQTRHEQTIDNPVGFALFRFCLIVTPIWQWVGAVIVFDYDNLESVARDVNQLMASNRFGDVLELISFGAKFKAQHVLNGVMHDETKVYVRTQYGGDPIAEKIAVICVDRLKQQKKLNNTVFAAAKDGNTKLVTYLVNTAAVNVDVQDDMNLTPLFYAAVLNHKSMVKTLLQDYHANCSISLSTDVLQWKLTTRIQHDDNDDDHDNDDDRDHFEIIKLLVEFGNVSIDIDTYNLAKASGYSKEILAYLNQAGKLDLDEATTNNEDLFLVSQPDLIGSVLIIVSDQF